MNKLALLLCLLASPAFAAEPPDWYAHIPAEQRAALLAARHADPPRALIDTESPLPYREPVNAPATFDASALVHPPQYSLLYRLWMQDRERRIFREYRTPDDEFSRWRRVGGRADHGDRLW